MFMVGSVVFFTRHVGLSPAEVGFGLSLAAAVGLLVDVPAGRLGDAWGCKRVLLVANALQAAAVSCYLLVDSVSRFLVVVVALNVAESAARPVRRALLSELAAGEALVRASAFNRTVSNVAFALGALLAGLALALDTSAGYAGLVLGDAASFLVATALLQRLPSTGSPAPPPAHDRPAKSRATRDPRRSAFRDRRFVAVAAVCAVMNLNASLLDVGLPLLVVTRTDSPRYVVALLTLLNMVLTVALSIRMSRGTEEPREAALALCRAGIALGLCCMFFASASATGASVGAVGLLVVAALFLTFGELFSAAGAWALSYGLAPPDRQAEYLGAFTSVNGLSRVVGPSLLAFVVTGGATAWLCLGAGFLAAAMAARQLARLYRPPDLALVPQT